MQNIADIIYIKNVVNNVLEQEELYYVLKYHIYIYM